MPRTLLVTNDFPPRPGGIQSYLHALAELMPADELVVLASTWGHDDAQLAEQRRFDAAQPFEVHRMRTTMMLPTPDVVRRAAELAAAHDARTVWFGAAAPLGLLAPPLRAAGAERVVATTHGHEAAWALLPGARYALRRIGNGADVVTYLGEYFRTRLSGPLGAHPELVQLTPGVDVETFRPGIDPSAVRERHGLGVRPVVVCVSRLVARKGQDTLIEALPLIRRRVPDAVLLLVGAGPYRSTLEGLARRHGVEDAVVFTGSVPFAELPAHFAAGDVFAMPCRTRRKGMDVEGLGIVFLEASAAGLPVVVGDSGGAPDAVRDGETGYLVDGRDPADVAARLVTLLADPALRERMGAAGRDWVTRDWNRDALATRLRTLLDA